ncbi:MAG: hypothetical protein FJX77_01465, partial [Armatimonadetes bacterium]|nr:hypothetical protein [Armatimonadota bacterium]
MPTTTTAFFADTTGYGAMERLLASQYNAVVSDMDSIRASRAALNLAGSGNYTASAAEYEPVVLECSGLLTGNRNLLLPLVAGARWLVRNGTSGSYTLTVKGATGSGIVISQGGTAWVWTDGVDFFRGTPDVEQDGDLSAGTVPATAIEDGCLTGTQVANTAAANVIGGLSLLHIVSVPAGATGDVDVVLTHKSRVTEVRLVKTAAAGGGAG